MLECKNLIYFFTNSRINNNNRDLCLLFANHNIKYYTFFYVCDFEKNERISVIYYTL